MLIGKLAIFAKKFDSFYSIGRIGKTFASETLSKKNNYYKSSYYMFFAFSLIDYKRSQPGSKPVQIVTLYDRNHYFD